MAFLFKPKPRGFNYKPRYYDPEAEEREDRKRVVLGDKYRSPAQRAREEAARDSGGGEDYVPGSILREHISARRGAHAADTMRKHRKKTHSIPILLGMLVLIILIVWILYFK